MSQESPPDNRQPSPPPGDELERQLEPVIKDLPPEKQQAIRHTFEQQFMAAFVERSTGPRIDAETARIIASTIEKDNENKFQYLTQKEKDAAEASRQEQSYRELLHKDRVKLLWPIVLTVLLVVVGCVAVGIYLAANGHEILGASILTGIFAAIFGYLGGLGTAHFFQDKPRT